MTSGHSLALVQAPANHKDLHLRLQPAPEDKRGSEGGYLAICRKNNRLVWRFGQDDIWVKHGCRIKFGCVFRGKNSILTCLDLFLLWGLASWGCLSGNITLSFFFTFLFFQLFLFLFQSFPDLRLSLQRLLYQTERQRGSMERLCNQMCWAWERTRESYICICAYKYVCIYLPNHIWSSL